MSGVVCAVAIGHLPGIGLVVDPSEEECANIDIGGCFAFMFAEGVGSHIESVWSSWRSQSGVFAEKDFAEAGALARAAAEKVYNAMKSSVSWMGTAEPFELASAATRRSEGDSVDDDNKMDIWYVMGLSRLQRHLQTLNLPTTQSRTGIFSRLTSLP